MCRDIWASFLTQRRYNTDKNEKEVHGNMKMRKAAGLLLTFALVFAAAFSGMSAEIQAASRIRLNRNTLTMTKGERFRLRVRNLPEGARVTWKSSNRRRATVSQNGVVRARKAGTVTIRSRVRFERDGRGPLPAGCASTKNLPAPIRWSYIFPCRKQMRTLQMWMQPPAQASPHPAVEPWEMYNMRRQ